MITIVAGLLDRVYHRYEVIGGGCCMSYVKWCMANQMYFSSDVAPNMNYFHGIGLAKKYTGLVFSIHVLLILSSVAKLTARSKDE